MKEVKQPLIKGYWESADLLTLHRMSRKWLSDLGFYKDELLFMQNLLQKHFLYFFEKERINIVNPLAKRLSYTLKKQLEQLEKEVSAHESQLVQTIKIGIKTDEKKYRMAHATLDDSFLQFEEDLKLAKQKLFQIAEKVLKEEKMKSFLAPVK
jgi:hypothetical protein